MKSLREILVLIVLLYALVILFFFLGQNTFIYFPTHKASHLTPPYQSINLTTADNLHLSAWYKAPAINKPTLLIMHGNADIASDRIVIAAPYSQLGWGIFLLEYRGYGLNPGKPSETGLNTDANAAWNFLIKQHIPAHCIILYGESLGAAVAVNLANQHANAAALILQSPFNRLVDVAQIHYPYLPASWLLQDKFDSESKIGQITMPILIAHGANDSLIPLKLAQKLYTAANHPKFMLIYPTIHHNDWNYSQLATDIQQTLGPLDCNK